MRCPDVSLWGLCFLNISREMKDQAQPVEKAAEKVLEEMKSLRGKALNSYLILE